MIATILLGINFLAFAFVGSDTSVKLSGSNITEILGKIADNLEEHNEGFELSEKEILPDDCWCILVDEKGDIIWSENRPNDIPEHYSINDIARLTKWFLNDYPVYVRTEEYGLLILGIPKNSVGKYDMQYSMNWFNSLPQRMAYVFIINLIFAAVFGIRLYITLKQLTAGITDLKNEKEVKLPAKGIFKELSISLNETSQTIKRKNEALAVRDNARSNWAAGISHDIRTPLALIMGNAEAINNSEDLSEDNKHKAGVIINQSIKVKKLVEDLSLISSLEYDMQPAKKKPVRICPLIRNIATDIINNGLSENFEISLDLQYEKAVVSGDSKLLERAFFNLLNNSIVHNKNGCKILIREYKKDSSVYIEIFDNGSGVDTSVIDKIDKIPRSTHGLGLPMAYKIINVHNGKFFAQNNNGFHIIIEMPL